MLTMTLRCSNGGVCDVTYVRCAVVCHTNGFMCDIFNNQWYVAPMVVCGTHGIVHALVYLSCSERRRHDSVVPTVCRSICDGLDNCVVLLCIEGRCRRSVFFLPMTSFVICGCSLCDCRLLATLYESVWEWCLRHVK